MSSTFLTFLKINQKKGLKMKKIFTISLLFLLTCTSQNIFDVQAQEIKEIPADSVINYHFIMNRTCTLTSCGVNILYDSTKVKILNTKKYNNFQFELIGLVNNQQGNLQIGFSNETEKKIMVNDTLFSVEIYVNFTEGEFNFSFENLEAYRGEKKIKSKIKSSSFNIEQLFDVNFKLE